MNSDTQNRSQVPQVPHGKPCSICNNYVHDLSIHPVTKTISCFLCIETKTLE